MDAQILTPETNSLYPLSPMTSSNADVDPNDILNYKLPDPSLILTERYSRFSKALQALESYAEGYSAMAQSEMKRLNSLTTGVLEQVPNFESSKSNVVSGAQVGANAATVENPDQIGVSLNFFFAKFRDDIGKAYAASVELNNKISTTVLPDVKAAQQEMEERSKKLKSSTSAANKDYSKVIKSTAAANNDLNASINSVKVKGKVDFKNDPFLVKRSLYQKAAIQIRASNDRVDFLQNLEVSSHDLENYMVGVLQRILNELTTILTNYFGSNINIVADMSDDISKVDSEISWHAFKEKNAMMLISSYIPEQHEQHSLDKGIENLKLDPLVSNGNPLKRDFHDVVFSNQHDPWTIPILEGNLYLREGLLKKEYKSIYVVLTPVGYLLGFPSKTVDAFEPTIVVYLPDSDLKEENDSGKLQFTLKGKDRSNVILRNSKSFHFKAGSHEDYLSWISKLTEKCG